MHKKHQGLILHPVYSCPSFFFNDLPLSEAADWEVLLQPQSSSIYNEIVKASCLDLDISILYINCGRDPLVATIRAMTNLMAIGRNWTIVDIDAGQAPFLSRVVEVGEMIVRMGKKG